MPALPRRLVDLLGARDRGLARLLVHVLAMRELLLDDVDLRDILQAARPFAGPEADDAAHDLGQSLKHHEGAGYRNDRLEVVDRRALRGHGRMLADPPRERGVVVARIDEGGDAGQEEDDVEDQIEPGLCARPHRAVEKVAAHMGILRQRVGSGEHEQRTVEHVAGVENPRGRHVHDVALEDLDADEHHQADDEPSRSLADPCADCIDPWQKTLDVHACARQGETFDRKASPGHAPMVPRDRRRQNLLRGPVLSEVVIEHHLGG